MTDHVKTLKRLAIIADAKPSGKLAAVAIRAVLGENERLERARKGWEETAHIYAQSHDCQEQMKDRAEGRLNAVLNFLTPPPEGSTDLIWWKPETSGLTPWILPKILKILQGEKPNGTTHQE